MGYGKRELLPDGRPNIRFLTIHHSGIANDMRNKSDEEVLKSFSDTGFEREYKPYGYNKETGYSPVYGQNDAEFPLTDKPSYVGYHIIVRPYDLDGNKYGWRVTWPITDIINHRVNSTGYDKNRDSAEQIQRIENCNKHEIAVCFAGNYVHQRIDINALHLLAFELSWLWGMYPDMEIHPHNYWQPTACPGKIVDQLDLLEYAFIFGVLK
jgi:hypothetical protein